VLDVYALAKATYMTPWDENVFWYALWSFSHV